MRARGKLNEAYLLLSVVWAAFIGWVFNSWVVFGTGAGILVGLNLVGGNIRLGGGHRLAGYRR